MCSRDISIRSTRHVANFWWWSKQTSLSSRRELRTRTISSEEAIDRLVGQAEEERTYLLPLPANMYDSATQL